MAQIKDIVRCYLQSLFMYKDRDDVLEDIARIGLLHTEMAIGHILKIYAEINPERIVVFEMYAMQKRHILLQLYAVFNSMMSLNATIFSLDYTAKNFKACASCLSLFYLQMIEPQLQFIFHNISVITVAMHNLLITDDEKRYFAVLNEESLGSTLEAWSRPKQVYFLQLLKENITMFTSRYKDPVYRVPFAFKVHGVESQPTMFPQVRKKEKREMPSEQVNASTVEAMLKLKNMSSAE